MREPRPNAKARESSDRLRRLLSRALREAGGSIAEAETSGPSHADLKVAFGRRRYLVELKYLSESRRELLQALLADAILRGRAKLDSSEEVIAVVAAPVISEATARAIEEYARAYAPGQPFGYADERGLVRLIGPALDGVRAEPEPRARAQRSAAQPRDLFSDLNQWLLKVLLGRELPEGLISVPRAPIGSAGELAARARASAPAVWRFFASLRNEGFLGDGARVVRARDLLSRWRAAALRPQRQVGAVWVMPGREPLARLKRVLADQQDHEEPLALLGLFAASDALGLGHVRGAPIHLYVRDLDPARLERLGLALAPSGRDADVQVRVARCPESVFRARVRRDGVPVADAIQCWLDVSAEPARGAEQAAFIWRRVLGPALADGKPQP